MQNKFLVDNNLTSLLQEKQDQYAEAVLKSEKLNTQAQQRGAVVQGRSLPPIPAPVYISTEFLATAHRQNEKSPFFTLLQRIGSDHKNYYSFDTLYRLGLATGFHAVLANTSIDQDFRDWYQDNMRSSSTNKISTNFKIFGEGMLWIPVFGITTGVYCLAQKCGHDYFSDNLIGEFSSRTIRSYLVGTPTLLFGQFMLGCSRPRDFRAYHSAWRPFQDDNSFSGHAFIGATPFLVAAQMTDRIWLKSAFYACSTFAGLSRINDDSHYLSQVLLGWFVAYLSVSAIHKTENMFPNRNLKIFPIINQRSIGIGISFSR